MSGFLSVSHITLNRLYNAAFNDWRQKITFSTWFLFQDIQWFIEYFLGKLNVVFDFFHHPHPVYHILHLTSFLDFGSIIRVASWLTFLAPTTFSFNLNTRADLPLFFCISFIEMYEGTKVWINLSSQPYSKISPKLKPSVLYQCEGSLPVLRLCWLWFTKSSLREFGFLRNRWTAWGNWLVVIW